MAGSSSTSWAEAQLHRGVGAMGGFSALWGTPLPLAMHSWVGQSPPAAGGSSARRSCVYSAIRHRSASLQVLK